MLLGGIIDLVRQSSQYFVHLIEYKRWDFSLPISCFIPYSLCKRKAVLTLSPPLSPLPFLLSRCYANGLLLSRLYHCSSSLLDPSLLLPFYQSRVFLTADGEKHSMGRERGSIVRERQESTLTSYSERETNDFFLVLSLLFLPFFSSSFLFRFSFLIICPSPLLLLFSLII